MGARLSRRKTIAAITETDEIVQTVIAKLTEITENGTTDMATRMCIGDANKKLCEASTHIQRARWEVEHMDEFGEYSMPACGVKVYTLDRIEKSNKN